MRSRPSFRIPRCSPSGRYLVRAIIDYGVDHYIGTQREMLVVRSVASSRGKDE